MARVAVVTGGTRGIGRAISVALNGAGYKVAATYGGNDAAAQQFNAETGIPVFKFDVSDFQACAGGITAIEAALGPVEVLVNNAGITRDATMHRMSFEHWNMVIQTNLSSCFNTSRQVIEGMRARGFGRIVNIGSMNGQTAAFGQANYGASKGGVMAFTKTAALELAKFNITVNVVNPGYTLTDMFDKIPEDVQVKIKGKIPEGRFAKPEEIARAVIFLVEDGDYITGQQINVNGGAYM